MEKEDNGEIINWFYEVNKKDYKTVGYKGANIAELFNNHFPVPEGFIINTNCFEIFLEKTRLYVEIKNMLNSLEINNSERISEISQKIRKKIIEAEFPEELRKEIINSYEDLSADKLELERGSARDILNNANEPIFVAVRSSITENIKTSTREQDTYLNVKGNDELIKHIQKCFASLFREETLYRNLSQNKREKLKIAIIIQKMVNAEKSGKIFCKDKKFFIESIWGLGEGMNSPEIEPDKSIVSENLEILDKKIKDKKIAIIRSSSGDLKKVLLKENHRQAEVLNNYEIQRLADLGQKIKFHFKKFQEIEFAIEEEIYILQTREIIEEDKIRINSNITEENNSEENNIVEKIENITKTGLKLILDSPHFALESKKTGISKIGFSNINKIIQKNGKHPKYYLDNGYLKEYENFLFKELKEMIEPFDEAYISLSDIQSDEKLEGNLPKEVNPFRGLHGIKFLLKYEEILESELKVIKKLSLIKNNLGILIPQISSIEELKKLKNKIKELQMENLNLGIILETPASIQLIKEFISEGIKFVLIELNDLSQNILILERGLEFFEEMSPALNYQLEYLIRVCKRNNVETNVMGNSLINPEILSFFINKRIDFICIEAEKAKRISKEIYKIEEEILKGTDEELRRYFVKKKEDELNKFLDSEEKLPNEEIPQEQIEKDIQMIEAEKQEYLSKNPE